MLPVPYLLLGVALLQESATTFIRVNQLGYRPDAPKVAVVCALQPAELTRFSVIDARSRTVLTRRATPAGAFAACVQTWRLDFSSLRAPGTYRILAGGLASRDVRIAASAYTGAADTLLCRTQAAALRLQSGVPATVHVNDGIVVDDTTRAGQFIPVSGGWADASDYLQYVTTSAHAAFVMLMAYRDHAGAFADAFEASGDPGSNGTADVLDEARHGLTWLLRMFPSDSQMYNQLGDDRDHAFADLIVSDSSDYGWGKGMARHVYPCTGRPQGLFTGKNRSTGYASTAGKYAASFALGAMLYRTRAPSFADTLARKAVAAYAIGKAHPGVCQTAPGRSPYFYEEDNWVDDMELGAAQLYALTREKKYLADALGCCARAGHAVDGCRHREPLPMVPMA
jgi:hypothetical protein